jgi:Tfp pilus assembly protein PilO
MRSRVIAVGVLLAIVVLLGWNLLIFAPKGRTLSHAKDDTKAAQQIETVLRATLARLQDISQNGPEIAAELDKLSAAVPESPDLDGFILSANQIAVKSGIDWLSVSPGLVQAGTPGPSVIPLTVQIKGGFFQVLDYLNRLEDMGRLVIVDGINVAAASDTSGGDAASTAPPTLSVTLTARMFTRAAPPAPAGSSPTPGSTGSTGDTTTTAPGSPPASGNSSGETSTTAVVN